jgi:glycosyltransferase 2 family protein
MKTFSLKFLLRLAITITILTVIMRSTDISQAFQILKHSQPSLLILAVFFQFSSTAVSAYRWQIIMQNLGFGQSFSFYWQSYFKGMFFNQGLPTSIGGDAVRVLDVASHGFRKRDALYGVMVDRAVGLGALMLLSLLAYLLKPQLLPIQIYRPMLMIILIGLTGFLSLLFIGKMQWLRPFPKLIFIKIIAERLYKIFFTKRLVLIVLSLLIPLLALLGFFVTGWALGLRYNLMIYFAIVPVAIILTIIPASIAGWGVREGALVGLFSLIGANKVAVLTMSLLYGITLIVVSLPGLITFLKGRHSTTAGIP